MSTKEFTGKGEFAKASEATAEMNAPVDRTEESQAEKAAKDARIDSLEKAAKPELKSEKAEEATLESGEVQAPAPETDSKLIQKAAIAPPKTQFL